MAHAGMPKHTQAITEKWFLHCAVAVDKSPVLRVGIEESLFITAGTSCPDVHTGCFAHDDQDFIKGSSERRGTFTLNKLICLYTTPQRWKASGACNCVWARPSGGLWPMGQ